MRPISPQRLRKVGIWLAFGVAVFATAATSAPSISIPVTPVHGTFHLDAGHPGALTRITVRISAEANSENYYASGVTLALDAVRQAGASGQQYGTLDSAHFILTTVAPGVATTGGQSAPPAASGGPGAGQVEVQLGRPVSLDLACGIGPCERAFWLIGELTDPDGGALEVDWQVHGAISYPSSTWPSGAAVTVEADPAILLAAPLPQLAASTDAEQIALGPDRPVAARIVEVRIGAAAIPADGSDVGTLSVDLNPVGGGSTRPPLVAVHQLKQVEGPSGPEDIPQRPAIQNGDDPFGDCVAGKPCSRRFLVTFAWTGQDGEETLDWRLTVRRTDLVRAWSTPAELSSRVERRIDIAPNSKSAAMRLAGEVTPGPYDSPPHVRVRFATATTATSPIARFLPVPAVMTFEAENAAPDVPPPSGSTGPFIRILPPARDPSTARNYTGSGREPFSVVTNPVAGCDVGQPCDDLTVEFTDRVVAPTVRVRWTMEVFVFSFTDIPVTMSIEGGS